MKTHLVLTTVLTCATIFGTIYSNYSFAQEGATVNSNEFIPEGLETENQNAQASEIPTEPELANPDTATEKSEEPAAITETEQPTPELEFETNAIDQNLNSSNPSGLVEVEPLESMGEVSVEAQSNLNLPYKERRARHGVIFGFGMEKFYPSEYYSLLDNTFVDDIFGGEPVSLMTLDLGYKFNFSLGSLTLTYNFASGQSTGELGASSRFLSVQKQAASVGYFADNILKEPWIVPYGQVGLHQFSVTEEEFNASATLAEDSATTGFALNYKAGLLFQLNWIEDAIDPTTHSEGLRSSGLENTYLDVSLSWYDPTQELFDPDNAIATADADPDLRSEGQLGIGLKLEF